MRDTRTLNAERSAWRRGGKTCLGGRRSLLAGTQPRGSAWTVSARLSAESFSLLCSIERYSTRKRPATPHSIFGFSAEPNLTSAWKLLDGIDIQILSTALCRKCNTQRTIPHGKGYSKLTTIPALVGPQSGWHRPRDAPSSPNSPAP